VNAAPDLFRTAGDADCRRSAIATLLPFAFMTLTPSSKSRTVLQIVRARLARKNVPSSTVIMAFAGALTILADGAARHAPERPRHAAARPRCADRHREWLVSVTAAAKQPIASFCRQNAFRARAHALLRDRARRPGQPPSATLVKRDDLTVVVPAFVVSDCSLHSRSGSRSPAVLGHRSGRRQRAVWRSVCRCSIPAK